MTVDLNLEHQAPLPKRKDYAIGAIGAGFIMRDCHLVAYGHAGYKVVAITSQPPAQAREDPAWRRRAHVKGFYSFSASVMRVIIR